MDPLEELAFKTELAELRKFKKEAEANAVSQQAQKEWQDNLAKMPPLERELAIVIQKQLRSDAQK